MTSKEKHLTSIVLFFLIVIACVFYFVAPIPQDLTYHDFVDQRTFFGIPNFFDVISNAAFSIVGLLGLILIQSKAVFFQKREIWIWRVFFWGLIILGFASGYYHRNPVNETLVWDRLFLIVPIMAFFSYIIYDRIHPKSGLISLPILLLLGVGSVLYWIWTESHGVGDLRPYAIMQFSPLFLTLIMIFLMQGLYTGRRYIVALLTWMIVAKICEYFDSQIFEWTQSIISGHTLKHVASAFGCFEMVKYIMYRRMRGQG